MPYCLIRLESISTNFDGGLCWQPLHNKLMYIRIVLEITQGMSKHISTYAALNTTTVYL